MVQRAAKIVADAQRVGAGLGRAQRTKFGDLTCPDPVQPPASLGMVKPGSILSRAGKEADLRARGFTAERLAGMSWTDVRTALKEYENTDGYIEVLADTDDVLVALSDDVEGFGALDDAAAAVGGDAPPEEASSAAAPLPMEVARAEEKDGGAAPAEEGDGVAAPAEEGDGGAVSPEEGGTATPLLPVAVMEVDPGHSPSCTRTRAHHDSDSDRPHQRRRLPACVARPPMVDPDSRS